MTYEIYKNKWPLSSRETQWQMNYIEPSFSSPVVRTLDDQSSDNQQSLVSDSIPAAHLKRNSLHEKGDICQKSIVMLIYVFDPVMINDDLINFNFKNCIQGGSIFPSVLVWLQSRWGVYLSSAAGVREVLGSEWNLFKTDDYYLLSLTK